MIKILQPKNEYIIEYPKAIEYAERQSHILWTPTEVVLEKDIHDILTNLNDVERHGIISVLKLFTLYELRVGDDYWNTYLGAIFKRPELSRMFATFSYVETGIHAPFYSKINELLGLDNEAFYTEYLNDTILSSRMSWLNKRVQKRSNIFDILKSIGTFSFIEGAILYSSFAFLKSFSANGSNKLLNLGAGINFSANDEGIHSEAGAWLFRTLLGEAWASGEISDKDLTTLQVKLSQTAQTILEHEEIIINKIFEKGEMKHITAKQLIHFVESRLDLCLSQLGIQKMFKPSYNPIAKWFYAETDSSILHDFFVTQGNDYNRNWETKGFVW